MERSLDLITVFESPLFGSVRTITVAETPYFSGKDVAASLGYKDTDQAIRTHCRRALTRPVETTGQVYHMKFIPEPDVYRLITHSRLPEAVAFEAWVYEEVLPSIRKTGGYSTPGSTAPQRPTLQMQRVKATLLTDMRNLGLISPRTANRLARKLMEEVCPDTIEVVVEGFQAPQVTFPLPVPQALPPAPPDRLIDVSAFLQENGYSASEIRKMSPTFGKVLKAKYITVHGKEPERLSRFVNGLDRQVCCYTEKDRPLFEQVLEEGMIR